jgi:hypothetical protein
MHEEPLLTVPTDLGWVGFVPDCICVNGEAFMTNDEPARATPAEQKNQELQEANTCLAIGAGIGAAGIGSAALIGATCPLCVVFAPALLGFGAWKRYKIKSEP